MKCNLLICNVYYFNEREKLLILIKIKLIKCNMK